MSTSFLIRAAIGVGALTLLFSACSKNPTTTNSQAAVNTGSTGPVDYSPRIGVAVRTASRTCMAIANGAVAEKTPVTLVSPGSPQSFVEAQISGPSGSACPITQEVAPGVHSYEITLPDTSTIPKLMPLIAVVGTAASSSFLMENISVQADINQTHDKNTFRACGADDGVYLTVWKGVPITGTRLWTGHYYEAGNPGTLPVCSAIEKVL